MSRLMWRLDRCRRPEIIKGADSQVQISQVTWLVYFSYTHVPTFVSPSVLAREAGDCRSHAQMTAIDPEEFGHSDAAFVNRVDHQRLTRSRQGEPQPADKWTRSTVAAKPREGEGHRSGPACNHKGVKWRAGLTSRRHSTEDVRAKI